MDLRVAGPVPEVDVFGSRVGAVETPPGVLCSTGVAVAAVSGD